MKIVRSTVIATSLFIAVVMFLSACASAAAPPATTSPAPTVNAPSPSATLPAVTPTATRHTTPTPKPSLTTTSSPAPGITPAPSSTVAPSPSPTVTASTSATATTTITTASASLPYTIVDTGQVKWYDASGEMAEPAKDAPFYGQDADFHGNQPAYRDNGDGTVTDLNTGLMWQQSPDQNGDGVINYSDKMYYKDALANASSVRTGGYTDWRLPTVKELYSLIQFTGVEPRPDATSTVGAVPFIDTKYFAFAYGDVSAGERYIDAQYATSTLYVGRPDVMFGVNFADGRIKGYPEAEKKCYVLYVRGNPAYGQNDFVNNGDGTITDRATGLMWSQADSGVGMDWQDALAWVQKMNAEDYLGHDDWRLPNAKELQSIVDYSRAPDATDSAAIDPVFTCTAVTNELHEKDYPYYWTGTTHLSAGTPPGIPSEAAYVAFGRAMGYMPHSPIGNGWVDIHGAGAQRSDPKSGDPADYPQGRGPQGDSIHILNFVRLVRDAG